MNNYYHPQTLEHIRNPLPAVAEWAETTSMPVPEYDPQTHNCRFVADSWVVEVTPPADTDTDPKIQESLSYLASTDWYYARLAETGQPVPTDVVDKRKAAREYLNQ